MRDNLRNKHSSGDEKTLPPRTRVALYARVSTDDQSTDMQLRELREYAASRKYNVIEEFVDTGFKGNTTSRPSLDRLMDAAKKKKFEIVLVWRFDRFARSSKHLVTVLDEFNALGIGFQSYTENIDTTSPMGKAMFTIIAAMAQLERDVIRERVTAGMKAAKARGVHVGRKSEYDTVKVRNRYAVLKSYRAVAEELGLSKSQVERIVKAAK